MESWTALIFSSTVSYLIMSMVLEAGAYIPLRFGFYLPLDSQNIYPLLKISWLWSLDLWGACGVRP